MGRKRGLYPACLRIARRTARVLFTLELDFWEAATTWKRPAYDSGSQDGAWEKGAARPGWISASTLEELRKT